MPASSSQSVLPWPKSLKIYETQIDGDILSQWLSESNPELKMLANQMEREKYAINLARKDRYPDVTFGVDYVVTDDAINRTSESGKDPVVAMLSINLPIWRKKYKAAVVEAKFRFAATGEKRTNRKNQLLADLSMVNYRFRDAERKINLFRDTLIPKAKQALNVLQKSYQTGKSEFLSLIDAERLLLEFELSYERAVADRMQRLAEIELLVGKSVEQ